MENNNVILFPNTKEQLLDQMYQALNNEDYTLSLEKSKQLLCNCINLHDVNVVKLISLIHLNRFIEAEAFCEPLLQVQSPHKEEYLEYYYMILYSSQQYAQLITHYKQLQAESPHLSNQTELTLYYELAYQENNRNIHLLIDKIKNAYQSHDDRLIFHHIQRLITISDSPHHFMIHLVKQKDVHPVIKTELLLWFKSCGLNKEIVVEKFGSEKIGRAH